VNSGGKDDHVGTEHLLDKGNRDGSSFINDQKLRLSQLRHVLRLDVLNRLPVVLEDINAHDCVVEFGVG